MKRLEPKEELEHLKSIYGSESVPELYSQLRDGFATLQSRSHVLLSLVTICLTITGFSGPSIAASGVVSNVAMVVGLRFISGRLLANGSFRSAMDYALSR